MRFRLGYSDTSLGGGGEESRGTSEMHSGSVVMVFSVSMIKSAQAILCINRMHYQKKSLIFMVIHI